MDPTIQMILQQLIGASPKSNGNQAYMTEQPANVTPTPTMLGTGAARKAGDLLMLQKMMKQAVLRGDYDTADSISLKIQEISNQKQEQ